jgi:hypothetical protein
LSGTPPVTFSKLPFNSQLVARDSARATDALDPDIAGIDAAKTTTIIITMVSTFRTTLLSRKLIM